MIASAWFLVSYGALWVLVIFLSAVCVGLVLGVYRLQERVRAGISSSPGESLRGKEAPRFRAVDVAGRRFESRDLAGETTALLFVSPDCVSCAVTLEELSALKSKAGGKVVVVCRADREQCGRLAELYGLDVTFLVDEDLEISNLFEIITVPTAVLIDEEHRVGSYGQPLRGEELEEMFGPQGDDELAAQVAGGGDGQGT